MEDCHDSSAPPSVVGEQDWVLLERWRDGDGKAGDRLFQRYFDNLYRFFLNKAKDSVEDLVQQTLEGCVKGRDRFRGDASFRAYLFGVARNTLYEHYKRKKREGSIDGNVTSLFELEPSPSSVLVGRHEVKLLSEAIVRIPLDLQMVLELHYWEGMSSSEIGHVLDIPAGTVRSRLRRAKEALRKRMEEIDKAGEHLESTMGNLERWVKDLRHQVPEDCESDDESDE